MPARIGMIGEPVADVTKFGWMIVTRKRKSLQRVIDSVNHTWLWESIPTWCSWSGSHFKCWSIYCLYRIPRAAATKPKILVPNHPNFYTNRKEGIACFSNLFSELQHDVVLFKEYVDKIVEQLLRKLSRKHMQLWYSKGSTFHTSQ